MFPQLSFSPTMNFNKKEKEKDQPTASHSTMSTNDLSFLLMVIAVILMSGAVVVMSGALLAQSAKA